MCFLYVCNNTERGKNFINRASANDTILLKSDTNILLKGK